MSIKEKALYGQSEPALRAGKPVSSVTSPIRTTEQRHFKPASGTAIPDSCPGCRSKVPFFGQKGVFLLRLSPPKVLLRPGYE